MWGSEMRKLYRWFLSDFGSLLCSEWGLWAALREAAKDTWAEWRRPVVEPLPSMREVIDATLRARGPRLAASLTRSNALLRHMLKPSDEGR